MGARAWVADMKWPGHDFPHLTDENCRVTSPRDTNYNCIAWSVGDVSRWWEPGLYWPQSSPDRELGPQVLVEMFRCLGFEECESPDLEPGFDKVAVYGNSLFYTHAARQLPSGKWTSKLGKCEDVEHNSPDDVSGGVYGELLHIMKRRVS